MARIKSDGAWDRQSHFAAARLYLPDLLRSLDDDEWEAEKAGWRCFVMGNETSCYRRGTRLHRAWQRGYDAASHSKDAAGLVL